MMDCLARTVKDEGVRALFKVSPAHPPPAPDALLCTAPLLRWVCITFS